MVGAIYKPSQLLVCVKVLSILIAVLTETVLSCKARTPVPLISPVKVRCGLEVARVIRAVPPVSAILARRGVADQETSVPSVHKTELAAPTTSSSHLGVELP